jgi:hypothetical protein
MKYLLFLTALSLSATAAYYSIMGLVAIFAAAAIPIFVMGSLLEVSKLVVASWLYRNWKEIPILLKSYFSVALVVLMLLTSMGIFGYLSKAHLDQAVPSGDVQAKLALIDEKIKTEKENINASRKELSQLDAQVDQTISRTTEASGTDRAIAIRRGQQKDRARILNEIGQAQAKIAKYNEERAPIASEVRKVEAEVGPIKYIAALIYGDTADQNLLESAVRIVILLIVFVFDPLAVLMLVAANLEMVKGMKKDPEQIIEEPAPQAQPDPEPVEPPKPLPSEAKSIIKDFFTGNKTVKEEVKEEEKGKEWEKQLYDRVEPKKKRVISYDTLGRRITPLTEQELIEIQVEELQRDTPHKAS